MLLFNKKCSNCQCYYDETLKECPDCHKSNELYASRDIPESIVFFHPFAQIGLFLCGFAYVGMLLCEVIFTVFFSGIANETLRDCLILFFTYLLMLGGLLAITLTAKARRKDFLKSFTRPLDYAWGAAFTGFMLIASLVIGMIVSIFYSGGPNANQEDAIKYVTNYPILMFFVTVFFGPICEELTYRVGLYTFLRRINKILAICVTAIVFAFIHFHFGAKDIAGELWSIPTYLACGALLSIAYEYHGPACSITAHMAFNLIAFLAIVVK